MVSKLSEIWSGFFIPDPDFLHIPDPGVKKAPDPGSGSSTLVLPWLRWAWVSSRRPSRGVGFAALRSASRQHARKTPPSAWNQSEDIRGKRWRKGSFGVVFFLPYHNLLLLLIMVHTMVSKKTSFTRESAIKSRFKVNYYLATVRDLNWLRLHYVGSDITYSEGTAKK